MQDSERDLYKRLVGMRYDQCEVKTGIGEVMCKLTEIV